MLRSFAAPLLALTLATPLFAFSNAERAAMSETVDRFNTAITTSDYDTVFSVMPPKIITYISEGAGIPADELRELMADQMRSAFATVTLESADMDVEAATYATTDTGRQYALIPTTVIMELPDVGRMKSTSDTLAFVEDGTWYLVRVDDPQQAAILTLTYPEFKGTSFGKGSVEMLE